MLDINKHKFVQKVAKKNMLCLMVENRGELGQNGVKLVK